MRFFTILLFIIPFELLSKEYNIHIERGWQLIGLPVNLDNLESFNNDNVRLMWSYNSLNREWLGFSPEKTLQKRILDKNLHIFNVLEKWHGFWIYSYNDWDLKLHDVDSISASQDEMVLYHGWNLLSLPVNLTVRDHVFGDVRIWKYSQSQWQTNKENKFYTFPKIDNINSKNGFWVYSENDKKINLNEELQKIYGFNSRDEVISYIKKITSLNNKNKSDLNETILLQTQTPKNNIGIHNGDYFQIYQNYVFAIKEDKKSIYINSVNGLLENRVSDRIITLTPEIGELTIKDLFLTENQRLVLISSLDIQTIAKDFQEQCRKNRVQVSIIDFKINENGIEKIGQKELQIDGIYKSSKMKGEHLYLLTQFSPCIQIDYPKIYLDSNDICFFSTQDNFENREECLDVYIDKDNQIPYRNNLNKPFVSNSYLIPQVWIDKSDSDLFDYRDFYASDKLNQNTQITTLSQIDIISGLVESTSSLLGKYNNIFFSNENLYMFSNQYGEFTSFNDTKPRETIYKFKYYPIMEYRGFGYFNNNLLNKNGVNEIDSTLMVATNKNILNFQERDSKLQQVGKLSFGSSIVDNVAFYGNRAVMTTNENELYNLYLNNAENPIKLGASYLAGAGKVELIRFLDNDNILTIGREMIGREKGGIRLALFNLSKSTKPTIESSETIGDYYNYTPIIYSSNAFAYDSKNRIFSIPVGGYGTFKSVKAGIYSYRLYDEENNGISIYPEKNGEISTHIEKESNYTDMKIFEKDNINYSLFYQNGKLFLHKITKHYNPKGD